MHHRIRRVSSLGDQTGQSPSAEDSAGVTWNPGAAPAPGTLIRVYDLNGKPTLLAPDGLPIGILNAPLNPNRRGLLRASVMAEPHKVLLRYFGPDDLWLVQTS